MKYTYFDNPCLGGFYGIALIHQFQSHKTVFFRPSLLVLIPVLLCGLWDLQQYSTTTDKLSVSLALQRQIIHAKRIKFPYANLRSNAYTKNRIILFNCLIILFLAISWSYLLLLLSGDVELNPGPLSADLSSSTESSLSYMNVSVFENNFSLVHYNVQSLLHKIDQIELELSNFDVIALSETWLSPATKDDDIKLTNFQDPFRKDRQTNNYGGVIVYTSEKTYHVKDDATLNYKVLRLFGWN